MPSYFYYDDRDVQLNLTSPSQVRVIAESYKLSLAYDNLLNELDAIKAADAVSDVTFQHINTVNKVLPWTEFSWLFWRSAIKIRRTYQQYVLRFFLYVVSV